MIRIKTKLQTIILATLFFGLFSCEKEKEIEEYANRFHIYNWQGTNPFIAPSSSFEHTFEMRDKDGYLGGIIGVAHAITTNEKDTVVNQKDTVIYLRDTVSAPLVNNVREYVSDTTRGKWFTIINEEHKQLRIFLDQNEGPKSRCLKIVVGGKHRKERKRAGVAYSALADILIIHQQSPEKEQIK